MLELRQAFSDRFRHWGISLPLSDIEQRASGVIHQAGWTIRYHFNTEDGREYVEFFASHRMTNDTLNRIYEDGVAELVDVCEEWSDPADPDGVQKAQAHNREFYKRVEVLGLGEPGS